MARFDRVIPPGGEGIITLSLRTKGFSGDIHKRARVYTNDSKMPELTIAVKAHVWVPVEVMPPTIQIKGILGKRAKEGVVRLKSNMDDPLVLNLSRTSIPDKVDVALKAIETGRTYELTVSNKVEAETSYRGTIVLTTNYLESPEIVIRVFGSIRPSVEVTPKNLEFGRMSSDWLDKYKTKSEGHKIKRAIKVSLNHGEDLEIVNLELTRSLFHAESRVLEPGKTVQIELEPVLEKMKKGLNEDHLRIYTNQKGFEFLQVQVLFEVI